MVNINKPQNESVPSDEKDHTMEDTENIDTLGSENEGNTIEDGDQTSIPQGFFFYEQPKESGEREVPAEAEEFNLQRELQKLKPPDRHELLVLKQGYMVNNYHTIFEKPVEKTLSLIPLLDVEEKRIKRLREFEARRIELVAQLKREELTEEVDEETEQIDYSFTEITDDSSAAETSEERSALLENPLDDVEREKLQKELESLEADIRKESLSPFAMDPEQRIPFTIEYVREHAPELEELFAEKQVDITENRRTYTGFLNDFNPFSANRFVPLFAAAKTLCPKETRPENTEEQNAEVLERDLGIDPLMQYLNNAARSIGVDYKEFVSNVVKSMHIIGEKKKFVQGERKPLTLEETRTIYECGVTTRNLYTMMGRSARDYAQPGNEKRRAFVQHLKDAGVPEDLLDHYGATNFNDTNGIY